jgi:tRNA pseudouridine13 synthase
VKTWPRLLGSLAPLPGAIKEDYEDFLVEEIPLYPLDGAGTHTYFLVEKRGLSTLQAVADISRKLGARRMDIGYAGLKDAKAVTRQWMSVEHIEPERVAALDIPRIRIVETTRHGNKLRLGHLKGNRFEIRVRRSDPERLGELRAGVETLAREGVPNYFGEQRFGVRGDGWQVGRAIIRGDLEGALDQMLGRPAETDSEAFGLARARYDAGDYAGAAQHWPPLFREERRALKALASGAKKKRAFLSVDRSVREFLISAYQSFLFNEIVAKRLSAGLGRLLPGDLAWLHFNGAVFRVEDLEREQARADALEISPSGPLFGYRMTQPEGVPGEMEAELLRSQELTPDAFHTEHLRVKGARRALRFPMRDSQVALEEDARGLYLALRFILPRGCYATTVLRELFVGGGDAEPADEHDSD